jgi:hypothetical protein
MGSADFRLVRPVAVVGDVAFSRTSPKWVFNRTGTLVQVPANTLAVTYDPSDLSKAPYALVEPASTNYWSSSDDFSQSIWNAGGAAKTPNAAVAPDGTMSACLFDDTGVSSSMGVPARSFTATASTMSVRFHTKSGGATNRAFLFYNVTDLADLSQYTTDFSYGSGAASNPAWRVTALPNGWFELECTLTGLIVGKSYQAYYGRGGGAYDNSRWYMWGADLVDGTLGSHITTTGGGSATRAADVIAPGAGLVYSSVPITEAPYNAATAYAKDVVVYDPATYLTYQSSIAGNVNKPLTDTNSWIPLKKVVNRRLMFDRVVNSQTTAANEVTVLVQPGELANTLGVLNVNGSSITVTQTDSGYSQTKSLVQHEVLNWYDWFYEEPIREGDVIFDGIPPYANSALSISVINPGDIAAIGCCILGKARTIGQTAWDFTGGVLSYSTSSTDTFGNVEMVKRDNSKVLNFEVYIPKGFESAAYRLLAKEYTDVEIMIIGAEDYSMTYAYGFLGQWTVPVSAGGEKTAHIEFKGLV